MPRSHRAPPGPGNVPSLGGGVRRSPGEAPGDELDLNVDLFIGCFNDTLFPNTGKATVAVLERLGHSVGFPMDQTCCGQMHFNTGYRDETLRLARNFVEVFSESEVVVSPAASCVGMVREAYPTVAENDQTLAAAVEELVPRVYE